jgi:HemY protein
MLRLVFYLLLIAPLVYGALWIADNPGTIVIDWNGWRIESSLGLMFALFIVASLVVTVIALILRFIFTIPSTLSARAKLKHYERGVTAMTRSMAALAISDYSQAAREIRKSRHHLGEDAAAPRLLSAQLAHAKGDRDAVRKQLTAMMDHPETRLVGLRGMIEQSLREGRLEQAINYAHEAWDAQPGDRWLALILIDLHTRCGQWAEAREVIAESTRKKALNRQDMQRYQAIVAYLSARQHQKNHYLAESIEQAQLARKCDPAFQPAQQLLIELYAESRDADKMAKLIQSSWKDTPHPRYAELLIEHFGDEPPSKFQRRMEKLAALNPSHMESELALARLAMHRKNWDGAREHLRAALAIQESPRIYEALAQVERAEHGNTIQANSQAAEWLGRAVTAPKDHGWHCTRCGHAHMQWQLHCNHCQAFDSLVWQQPDHLPPPADIDIFPNSGQLTGG